MDIMTALFGSGALTAIISATVLGIKLFKTTKEKTKDNESWTEVFGDFVNAAGEYQGDVEDLIEQVNGVIRAVDKDTKSKQRLAEDKEEFEAIKKKVAEELGPEAVNRLSEALEPVPSYVHENLGSSDDKVRKLVETQKEALNKKERANKILSDSGKMIKEVVKALTTGVPKIREALDK